MHVHVTGQATDGRVGAQSPATRGCEGWELAGPVGVPGGAPSSLPHPASGVSPGYGRPQSPRCHLQSTPMRATPSCQPYPDPRSCQSPKPGSPGRGACPPQAPPPAHGGGSGGRRGASRGLVTLETESLTHLRSACGDSHIEIHGAQTFWGPRGFVTWGCELAQGHVDEWLVGGGVMTPRNEEGPGRLGPGALRRVAGPGAGGQPGGHVVSFTFGETPPGRCDVTVGFCSVSTADIGALRGAE